MTARVSVSAFLVPKQVKMNTALEVSFVIQAQVDSKVIVDYIIFFQKRAGQSNSSKVFKLTKLVLTKNKPVTIFKRHMLRQHMTTRTLYPGRHEIAIQVNGKVYAESSFILK